jgi:hypothetical protein
MARGRESKSVEAQHEAATSRCATSAPVRIEHPEIRSRRAMMLARINVLSNLQRACAPAHRAMLEQTMGEIDRHLATLQ